MNVPTPESVPAALAQMEAERAEALLVTYNSELLSEHQRIMQFAVQRRLPTITDIKWTTVQPGPLLSYAPQFGPLTQQAASYIVRILKQGVKPGDLPIQQPAKFEMVVNLKTARAINLKIPQSVLLQATEVIE